MRKKDYKGQRFGRLIVVREAPKRGRQSCWYCQCDCGMIVVVRSNNLKSGNSTSCGCFRDEILPHNKTHGMTRTPLYAVWRQMIQRCINPKAKGFNRYGARGITVCQRWRNFQNFYEDMGDRFNGATIERINTNGNYEPENCRWATMIDQARNKTSNRLITLWGKTQSLAAWTDELDMNYQLVHRRLRNGWSEQDALTIAPRQHNTNGVRKNV